jgi:hypothetical protein
VSADDLVRLGHRPGSDPGDRFNMAVMGMHLAERRNGVSRLHGEVSREMFADLWPGVPTDETPVGHVTNGVHGDTWVGPELSALFEQHVGADWQWSGPDAWAAVDTIGDDELWQARLAAKVRMVEHVRERLRSSGLAVGRSPSELEWVDDALDPAALTICFARRFATYKRAALLLSQPERLAALIGDDERPVQFVFAGKAHPADDEGKELIRQVVAFAQDLGLRHRFVFVEDYDMAIARSLVQGADVWLNTPVKPMEASGTSGMKAVLNGALHCSILDGWWAECFDDGWADGGGANGFAITSADGIDDQDRRDEVEAGGLFELLEHQVVPLYHPADRSPGQSSPGWVERQRASLRTLGPFVSAHRMVRDYVRELYLPAAAHAAVLGADGHRGARELAAYRARLDSCWHQVHIDAVDVSEASRTSVTSDGSTRSWRSATCVPTRSRSSSWSVASASRASSRTRRSSGCSTRAAPVTTRPTTGSSPRRRSTGRAGWGSRFGSCRRTRRWPLRSSSATSPGPTEPAAASPGSGELGATRTVLQERGHAHPGVLGPEGVHEAPLLQVEAVREGQFEATVHGALGQCQRPPRPGGQGRRPLQGRLGGVTLHDDVDESDALGLLGVDDPSREHQVLGPGRPDQSGEPLGAAAARDDPEQDLRLGEPGSAGRDAEVAGEGELAPTAEGHSVHGGDRRTLDRGHRTERPQERATDPGHGVGVGQLEGGLAPAFGELGDVGAGSEQLGAAGDHDGPRPVVGLPSDHVVRNGLEFAEEFHAQGVDLRVRQGQHLDAVVAALVQDQSAGGGGGRVGGVAGAHGPRR